MKIYNGETVVNVEPFDKIRNCREEAGVIANFHVFIGIILPCNLEEVPQFLFPCHPNKNYYCLVLVLVGMHYSESSTKTLDAFNSRDFLFSTETKIMKR